MDYRREHLNRLAEKFWNGETSIEEEAELKQILSYSEDANEWDDLKAYFEMVDQDAEELQLGEDFDQKVLAGLTTKKPKVISIRKSLYRIAAAAAVLIIAVSVGLWSNQADPNENDLANTQPTEQEIQEAYEQTQEALFLISSKMNKGKKHALSFNKFETAQMSFKKSRK
ncbi:MAG: hypothetical protein HRT74_02210 [Flavobacteriales bacterium]|nr:hypothetical protein [Flavobacteriales bacterium]